MPSEDVVKSVGRVMAVLELFETVREPLSANQIERRLDYPQSSTLALLKSIVRLGYMSFDPLGRTYFPTMRVASLGQWLGSSIYGHDALPALLRDINTRTGETVALSCQNDLQMQFIESRPGGKPLTVNTRAGDFAPLFNSIIGLTSLSVLPNETIAKLVARGNRAGGELGGQVVLAKIMERVEDIRAKGYGVAYNTYIRSIGAVAWALPAHDNVRPLVLSVAAPSDSFREELDDILGHVHAAIRAHLP